MLIEPLELRLALLGRPAVMRPICRLVILSIGLCLRCAATAAAAAAAAAGFELIKLEKMPSEWSHKARAGREWLGRWKWTGQQQQLSTASGSKM